MSRRPTIKDLARESGVSVATVDRVLNNRHRVRENTAQRVLLAAERIGYHAAGLIRQRMRESMPHYRFHFILQKGEDYFYQQLGKAMEQATAGHADINGEATVEFVADIVPGVLAERLHAAAETADAIAIVAVNHTQVSAAIDEISARGIPVFCLLSDVVAPGRAGFLGVDNRKRGRTAAWAISRLSRRPGQVGIMLGTHRYLGQEMSEISFRSYLREYTPRFTVMESIIDLDDSKLAYEAAMDMVTSNPDLVGIFSAGGGVEGLIQALRDERTGENLIVVCNELTPTTREALLDGTIDMVTATPIERLSAKTIEAMIDALGNPNRVGMTEVPLNADLYISESV
ncbi:LacI family DNA-binding transcriptional regulator [Natronospirillum operosum]|uniref:LacI family DNA-binding transcriptional regulator n=1 Tax=Natronospirillum operosum TaxID=2759953 RepID=A0A4Z0WHC6_9GAMM|nr:LacI family DNA-binding transcriptional regulator [Natronospirillum operosum]TGG95176.1 LacI family DNA-binding transcriptional regulator [Natronospirillum operosum]